MNERVPLLAVRIKLVDLNRSGYPTKSIPLPGSGASATVMVGTKSQNYRPCQTKVASSKQSEERSAGEICMKTGSLIESSNFEDHIETCPACASRVDLQLGFIDTLEAAIYQRKINPDSGKIGGAMMISAPELNFAICGELEL